MLDPRHGGPELSVVIPCYNEEDNAAAIGAAVVAQLEKVSRSFEIIFIDNGSSDRTVEIVRGLCAADPRIKLIVNTRNFGQMRSPSHAVFEASGQAVIGVVADFQDPPELIPQFVERWRAGADIVLGVSESKRLSPLLAASRRLSYQLQRKFGDYPIIPNATGFGLYDARSSARSSSSTSPSPSSAACSSRPASTSRRSASSAPRAPAANRRTDSSRCSISPCPRSRDRRRDCFAVRSTSASSSSARPS